ncbi:MAG: SPASM domain-containing protein [Flavobacteriales bacterium]
MPKIYWNDSVELLRKITLRKVWNYHKLLYSYFWSKWRKKPYVWANPFSISIEPTTSCNLRCPECPSGLRAFTRDTGMLDKEFFTRTIDELSPDLLYLIFYFQGEPYLNTKFLDMVAYASKKGIYTATSTNAHYLTDANCEKTIRSGLSRMIISIDGTTQETYESYRIGGNLEKVLEGAKRIVKWKKELKSRTPHLIFQFLVVRPNEHQIDEVYRLAEEIGIDEVRLKTAQVYNYENGNELIPLQERYSRYKKNSDGTYSIKNKMVNSCWRMWQASVITWDGIVVPCCFDKDATHRLGNLKEQKFAELWKGEGYQQFRRSLLKSRSEIDICKNCTEGTKVWA